MQLKLNPIVSITGIYYRSGDYDSPTWTAYSAKTDFIQDAAKSAIYFTAQLPAGRQNIKVTYRGGYTAPSTGAPESLRLACEKLVAKLFNKRKAEGVASEGIGGLSINWESVLDLHTKALLDPFRNISL